MLARRSVLAAIPTVHPAALSGRPAPPALMAREAAEQESAAAEQDRAAAEQDRAAAEPAEPAEPAE